MFKTFNLTGDSGLINSVLFQPQHDSESTVVFFPGDVQDIEDEMLDAEWLAYSLDKTISLLSAKFPDSNILIVRPARVEGHYSVFEHLTKPGHVSLHLYLLLASLNATLGELAIPEDEPLVLCGFSRGVIVLNHLIAEMATLQTTEKIVLDWQADDNGKPIFAIPADTPDLLKTKHAVLSSDGIQSHKAELTTLFSRVREIHYLDGHRFPTHPLVCHQLAEFIRQSGLKFFIHMSPRQKYSQQEPWGPQEWAAFEKHLLTQQTKFYSRSYLEAEPQNLTTHFKILNAFIC